MNPFHDTLPDIPACPRCGHEGDGLEWAFDFTVLLSSAQCACLKCGAHGVPALTYEQAIENFRSGRLEEA